ncbi:MAG: ice-binding family protein [Candidatus Korobacteraceae bacterium]
MKLLRVCCLVLPLFALTAHADVLGSADAFGILGASTVTNTGPSVVFQNLGVAPGTSITGFPPGIVLGTIHDDDAVAMQAQADALTGYNFLAGLAPTQILTGQDLGGLTLHPGVFFFASSAQMTGTLTLDFEGLSNMMFVFQIGSTLTTASASSVMVTNPGSNDEVFWQVGSSATLGTTTDFYGSIIADQSITLNTGANITCGRAIALNGAVTMDTNNVDTGNCAVGTGTTPEPGTIALVATGGAMAAGAGSSNFSFLGLGSIAAFFRKRKR